MKIRIPQAPNALLLLLLFAGSFLFVCIHYIYTYLFLEQFQLFQTSVFYLEERLNEPGGMNEYLSAVLAQFFRFKYGAPLLFATLLTGITGLFMLFLRMLNVSWRGLPACIPALIFLINPAESPAPLTCVFVSLTAVLIYCSQPNAIVRRICGMLGLIILYFLDTPAQILFAFCCAIFEFRSVPGNRSVRIYSLLLIGCSLLLPLLALRYIYVIPLREAFLSKYLAHPEHAFPAVLTAFGVSFPLISALLLPVKSEMFMSRKFSIIIPPVVLTTSFLLLTGCTKNPMEQAYYYDYLVRNNQWQSILDDVRIRGVQDKNALVYQNLALSHTGKMGDRFFQFRQSGVEGLMPQDPKSRLELIQATEVAWQLGHIQAAQRFAFVGVLSSQRCVQPRLMLRLIETYLVQEEYRAAEKYMKILESSPVYAAPAHAYRPLLDPVVAAQTPWIAEKRSRMPQTDNAFDLTKSFPNAVAYLIDDHAAAHPVFGYGMSFLLLYKELHAFAHYMDQYRDQFGALPVAYQEALCFYYTQVNKDQAAFNRYPVDQAVTDRYLRFMQAAGQLPASALQQQYGDTYYYYACFNSTPR